MIIGTSNGNVMFVFEVITKSKKHPLVHQLSGLWPIIMIYAFLYSCFNYSSVAVFCPAMMILAVGPFFALCAARLILASVSKTEFSLLDNMHLTFPFFCFIFVPYFCDNNEYLNYPRDTYIHTQEFQTQFNIFKLMIGTGLMVYLWFVVNAISQITEYLDIYCLSIKKKSGDKD